MSLEYNPYNYLYAASGAQIVGGFVALIALMVLKYYEGLIQLKIRECWPTLLCLGSGIILFVISYYNSIYKFWPEPSPTMVSWVVIVICLADVTLLTFLVYTTGGAVLSVFTPIYFIIPVIPNYLLTHEIALPYVTINVGVLGQIIFILCIVIFSYLVALIKFNGLERIEITTTYKIASAWILIMSLVMTIGVRTIIEHYTRSHVNKSPELHSIH